MLKINPIQTNFTSGELSRQLLGRSDTERFFNGGEKIENFFVRPQGGLLYRPGSINAGRARTSSASANVRVLDFVFSYTDAIAIEISAGHFRFIRDGEFIESSPGVPVDIAVIYGTATAIPYTSDDIHEIQVAQSADVIYLAHPDHKPAMLSRYSDTDWRYEEYEHLYGPFMDQSADETETSITATVPIDRLDLTSSNSGDFAGLSVNDYVQYDVGGTKVLGTMQNDFGGGAIRIFPAEDFCFLLSKEVYSPGVYTGWDGTNNVPTYSQTFTGSVSVAFSKTGVVTQGMIGGYINFQSKDGTYYWMHVTGVDDIIQQGAYGILAVGTILTVSIPTGRVTRSNRTLLSVLRASSAIFDASIDPTGRQWRLILGDTVVYATGRAPNATYSEPANSTTSLAVDLNRTVPRSVYGFSVVDEGTTHRWNKGAWYVGNYPATVGFHEERLCFAGTLAEPQTGWMTMSADFVNFALTSETLSVLDNSAITFTVAGNTVNQAMWLASRKILLMGTAGGEWALSPSNSSATALTPTNASAALQSSYGSAYAQPVSAANSVIYLQLGGHKLRQMSYDYQVDGQVSLDLTIWAEHILREHGGGLQVAYQRVPESVVYVRCADGQVCMLTYEPDQKVYAWSRLILGGDGFCESICVIPDGTDSYLYLVVSRTVDGANVRTIEYIPTDFQPEDETDWAGTSFLDNCYESVLSGTVTSVTGLSDYLGMDVWCQIGTVFFSGTVSVLGALEIPEGTVTAGKLVRVGFQYEGWYKSFPIETQAQMGTGQGKPKRIDHLTLRLRNSTNFSHGWDVDDLRLEDFRESGDDEDAPPPMRSEDFRATFDNGIDTDGVFHIKQTEPYPLAILAIMPEMVQMN